MIFLSFYTFDVIVGTLVYKTPEGILQLFRIYLYKDAWEFD